MGWKYKSHKITNNLINSLLYTISLNFSKYLNNLKSIKETFEKEHQRRINETKGMEDIILEKIGLLDIILIEELPKLLRRIKKIQKENNVPYHTIEQTKKSLNERNVYHKWRSSIDIDSFFLKKNKDNLKLELVKYNEHYVALYLTIIIPEEQKTILKNIAENFCQEKYCGEFKTFNDIKNTLKYWFHVSWKNKTDNIELMLEDFIIKYINKYQKILWGIFFEEKIYPPINLITTQNGIKYREVKDKDFIILDKIYNSFWWDIAYNDTLKNNYIESVKRKGENQLLSIFSVIIDTNIQIEKQYHSASWQVLSRNEEDITLSRYLFTIEYFLAYLENKVDFIYSKIISLWKKWWITLNKALELQNSLNWYMILFQRLDINSFDRYFKDKTKLQTDSLIFTINEIKNRTKEKIDFIKETIKSNTEYKIVKSNVSLQKTAIRIAIIIWILAIITPIFGWYLFCNISTRFPSLNTYGLCKTDKQIDTKEDKILIKEE